MIELMTNTLEKENKELSNLLQTVGTLLRDITKPRTNGQMDGRTEFFIQFFQYYERTTAISIRATNNTSIESSDIHFSQLESLRVWQYQGGATPARPKKNK